MANLTELAPQPHAVAPPVKREGLGRVGVLLASLCLACDFPEELGACPVGGGVEAVALEQNAPDTLVVQVLNSPA